MSVSTIQTTKLGAARKIMRALRPAEDCIDGAILASTDLIGSIIRGRMDTGAALESGHVAAQKAANTLALLFEARKEALLCHEELAETRDKFGLRAEDVGCELGKIREPQGQVRAA
jgi:hypothetical protein